MQQEAPHEEMLGLLKDKRFGGKVIFLEGNVLFSKDLARASAETAKCIIILADKHSQNSNSEDYRNILHASSVKQYVRSVANREIRVCLQILRPENKDLFSSSLNYGPHDQLICVDELKLYLLGKTCICPGINTIVSTLITSSKPSSTGSTSAWINDYLSGLQNEIYRVPLEAEIFAGLPFSVIAQHIYKEFEFILFALEVNVNGTVRVFLNPSDYIFQDVKHYGYVFADSLPDVDKLSSFKISDQIQRSTFGIFTPKLDYHYGYNKGYDGTDEKNKKKYFENIQEDANVGDLEYKMKNFYYGKINSLESATITGNEEVKFENHIIICGIIPGMRHLLLPLRARSLKNIHPIIILYNDPMPTHIWKQINRFPKIYFMQGSPQKLIDLDKACIQKALAVVILSKHTDQDSTSTTSMADADTIFIYKTIKSVNPNVRIITELTSTSTIGFLSHTKSEMQRYGYMASEPFAAGEIYISTMLDTLICQAYYNPFITSLLDQLIMGTSMLNYKSRKYLSQLRINSSTLFIMNIPVKYIDKTFGYMFENFITESKMIAIGLYRERNKGTSRYVFIKPTSETKLNNKDKVYVLCQKQPKNAEMASFEDDELRDMPKLLAEGVAVNIKSKLGGEEGRIDTEVAKELLKVNQEIRGIANDLKAINHDLFAKGFTNEGTIIKSANLTLKDFVPEVRKSLRKELGAFSNS